MSIRGDYGSCAEIPMTNEERERADAMAREWCADSSRDDKSLLLARRTIDLLSAAERLTLGEPSDCMDCGLPYAGPAWLDLVIPREQWLLIHPDDGGILCANCLIARASKLPHVINITGRITFGSDFD